MPQYDLTLDSIDLPTAEQDFSETLGSDFELVGAVPMPGAPRPASFYNINIPVYGEPDEVDPWATGDTKRDQVRSLLQNASARFAGIQLSTSFDPTIDGWLVIGTAELSYGTGGPTFGDYMLRIAGAALIPAQQTLSAHRLTIQDRRSASVPLDPRWSAFRAEPVGGAAKSRHYLPIGAYDIVGQVDPHLPDVGTYDTLWGEASFIDARTDGEVVTFEIDWETVGRGDVRIYEPNDVLPKAKEDLINPQRVGWKRVYGPLWPGWSDVPVLDNGVCRVRHTGEGKFLVDTLRYGKYVEAHSFTIGHPRFVNAGIVSWSTERAEIRAVFAGKSSRAEIHIALQRGWPGPSVDVYHLGDRSRRMTLVGDAHTEEIGDWQHARFGVGAQEALAASFSTRRLIAR